MTAGVQGGAGRGPARLFEYTHAGAGNWKTHSFGGFAQGGAGAALHAGKGGESPEGVPRKVVFSLFDA